MTREDYIKIGGTSAIENKASFEKICLYVSNDGKHYNGKHYGLYGCFTVMTQHTYGTKEELLFILGVMSTHGDKMETDTHAFYKKMTDIREKAYAMAEVDTLEEMKRIGKLEGVEVEAENQREAYDKYFSDTDKFMGDNYFYWYRMGKALYRECELIVEMEGED